MDKSKRQIVVICHNLRSAHNVGSLLRTAEGLGVEKVYLTGYTPFPLQKNDQRLPHLAKKINKQIQKTALGAEKFINWKQFSNATKLIDILKQERYEICALEQSPTAIPLNKYRPVPKIALIVGNEVSGVDPELVALSSKVLEIPMFGKKESFNVTEAASIAMFYCRFF